VPDLVESSGFPPVIGDGAQVLVLGSLPGVESIRLGQYYGHPRNALWRILGDVFDINPERSYSERCAAVLSRNIALWDVLASSVRPGSLDSAIDERTAKHNDFNGLLSGYPTIRAIGFNGQKARALFDKRVLKSLRARRIPELITLPSTSPAHAAMPYDEKLVQWRALSSYLVS
jgi:TDG/mug DNA glycosylase family protein